jgi:hypothetical protein
MRQVYSQATEMNVWLGGTSDESDQAIDLIDVLSDVYSDCYQRSQTATRATKDIDLTFWGKLFVMEHGARDDGAQNLDSAALLVSHMDYSRSGSVSHRNGTLQIQLLRLGSLVDAFTLCDERWNHEPLYSMPETYRMSDNPNFLVGRVRVDRMDNVRILYQTQSYISLLLLHTPHSAALSTDPRDKFIALLGMPAKKAGLLTYLNSTFNQSASVLLLSPRLFLARTEQHHYTSSSWLRMGHTKTR